MLFLWDPGNLLQKLGVCASTVFKPEAHTVYEGCLTLEHVPLPKAKHKFDIHSISYFQ